MDNQEFFDIVWERAKTKKRAVDLNTGRCLYRTEDGNCCFIGAAIPDESYRESLDNGLVGVGDIGKYVSKLRDVDPMLMNRCQSVHDGLPPSTWEHRLRTLATEFDLKVPS